jgi:hypothetical protein
MTIKEFEKAFNVIAKAIDNTTKETMQGFVRRVVSTNVSLVATNDHSSYGTLNKLGFKHTSVRHPRGECVRGVVNTAHLIRSGRFSSAASSARSTTSARLTYPST